MTHRPLAPVFAGLRAGLHALFGGLLALVVARVLLTDGSVLALVLAGALGAVYLAGLWIARAGRSRRGVVWVAALTVVWAALVWLVPEAAYLVFPLFFLYLHVLPGVAGPVAVVGATALTIAAFAVHGGLTVGGVVGPVVGAGVALLIGLGYGALERRAAEREALMAELLATRDRLAAAEREQGTLAERARLARELHDTVAQGLSSIQMLLHAAERADADGPGIDHVRLARQTAADGLAETRRFIRELSPPSLDRGLGSALERLAAGWGTREGIDVEVEVDAAVSLPMDAQTALLRIAQGALANVAQHAGARRVSMRLVPQSSGARLTISDDGAGFDASGAEAAAAGTDSFGLRAMRERVDQLDGVLEVDSAPGVGSTITVVLPGATS
ncbi:signal transduction histidine kinase [Microbacterium sp. AG157]|uniref:Oxygen sensor histidine kinase NreB n=1 Tax=Microbacterium testaceum TaxID=2033 RepID=A0A4Y3QKU4_MICTE|nr:MULTISPECIES: sensor histidine kinase [Microbacterium]REC98579.1 signal transduction histidine kinase [Microbacterium sp. AG157]WJS90166.1 sensor histidine kinase [Microbacterium testaceum]GEB45303.1 two-component sensor histidine kinase [Microbacterium testaceum]